jgi:arsenate reductase (thioredoxin)
MEPRKVLILCTGNSCRSQIAEALVNRFLPEQWQAYSAGTHPSGTVQPLTLRVLEEIGIQHAGQSKSADVFRGMEFDVVITVCDDAAENCPVWLGKGQRVHLGFPDPAQVEGDEDQKMAAFRQVRDEIHDRLLGFLREYLNVEKGKE